jgi:hypothetical protein
VALLRWFYARQALWYLLACVCILYPLSLDRQGMIDNDNYVDYFVNGPDLEWLAVFTQADSWLELVFRLSTDEILWLLWTTLAGSLMPPEMAVYATVVALNSLFVLAVRDYRNRSLALALWLLIPVGFAVIGTYQIRQGLAFALWLYLGVRRERLVLASVLAALVHTTFGVVAILSFLATRRSWTSITRLVIMGATSVGLALAGQIVFETYGGRRVETYLLDEATLTTNFLIGLIILLVYPLSLSLRGDRRLGFNVGGRRFLHDYVLLYVGIMFFLVVSFFLFPLGNYRLPYIAWLGLIPIFGQFNFGRMRDWYAKLGPALPGFGVILIFLAYQSVKGVLDNRYACLFVSNCADVLSR